MADGNATTDKESLFDKVRKEWIAEHGGTVPLAKKWRPDPKSSDNYKEKVSKARAAVREAEKLVAESKKSQDEAEAEAIRFFGPNNIKLKDGTVLEPTCRGDRLFYKDASDSPL